METEIWVWLIGWALIANFIIYLEWDNDQHLNNKWAKMFIVWNIIVPTQVPLRTLGLLQTSLKSLSKSLG